MRRRKFSVRENYSDSAASGAWLSECGHGLIRVAGGIWRPAVHADEWMHASSDSVIMPLGDLETDRPVDQRVAAAIADLLPLPPSLGDQPAAKICRLYPVATVSYATLWERQLVLGGENLPTHSRYTTRVRLLRESDTPIWYGLSQEFLTEEDDRWFEPGSEQQQERLRQLLAAQEFLTYANRREWNSRKVDPADYPRSWAGTTLGTAADLWPISPPGYRVLGLRAAKPSRAKTEPDVKLPYRCFNPSFEKYDLIRFGRDLYSAVNDVIPTRVNLFDFSQQHISHVVDNVERAMRYHSRLFGKFSYRRTDAYATFVRKFHESLYDTTRYWLRWSPEFLAWATQELRSRAAKRVLKSADARGVCLPLRGNNVQIVGNLTDAKAWVQKLAQQDQRRRQKELNWLRRAAKRSALPPVREKVSESGTVPDSVQEITVSVESAEVSASAGDLSNAAAAGIT